MSHLYPISFDYAIKYLLKNKADHELVGEFISVVLGTQGFAPVTIIALLETESNKEEASLKRSVADLIVEDANGVKYIVEIEGSYTSHFLGKSCFNTSRLIVDNLETTQDYGTIKKIFHITLLFEPPAFMKSPLYYGDLCFRDCYHMDINNQSNSEEIHIQKEVPYYYAKDIFPEYFVISIPRFKDIIQNDFDEWLYTMKHSEVPKTFKSKGLAKLQERLNTLFMSKDVYREYEIYKRSLIDEKYRIEDALKKEKEEGLKEGMEKGREEGERKAKIEMAYKMLKLGIAMDTVLEETGLQRADLEES